MYKRQEDALPGAILYLQIYFLGMIPNVIYNMGTGILRAVGDSRRPLYFLIAASLCNIVLDLVLVLGFHLGVAGVAIATICSQLLSAALVLSLIHICICNGFQALVKLGLVPYGEIREMDENCPTLTFNTIGRHQSRYVTTRVASVQSPWMLNSQVGDLHTIAISHGEGRFVGPQSAIDALVAGGQVATQYVDPMTGTPSMGINCNPNGSLACIEGIFSPDGRVFGKMGHTERRGPFVGINIPGEKNQPLFDSGAAYFK